MEDPLDKETLNTYNEELDEEGSPFPPRILPSKMIDVVPAWDAHQPVRFLLQLNRGGKCLGRAYERYERFR